MRYPTVDTVNVTLGGPGSRPLASVGDVADLLGAVIWPLVILAIVYLFRLPLRQLAGRIGTSASSVSIGPGGVKIDFGAAVSSVGSEETTVLGDLRSPAPALADSAAPTMFEQLAAEEPAPNLLVDLGEGHDWLSSRLYLFALMLATMRRTRTLVFVETLAGVRGRFVGLAGPRQVHNALAAEYPWLEADYANAYAEATTLWRSQAIPNRQPLVLDPHGRLSQAVAQALVRLFLENVKTRPIGAANAAPEEWVDETVDGIALNEHARWLRGADVERIVGAELKRWAYITETAPRSPSEIAAAALPMTGHDSVALLDDQHRFKGLVIDRRQALEVLGAHSPHPEPSSATRGGEV
jgi:hypothetical protein